MSQVPPLEAPAAAGRAPYAKSRDTRARILEAALAEASESGFHKTSLARIAARAGVAIGNLHYHFGSRRGLLRELMGSLVSDLMSRLDDASTEENAGFFERQRSGLLAYLGHLRANPAHVRLADEIKLHEPALYQRAVAEWVERLADMIRQGVERGTLRAMDEAEIAAQAHFMLGARHFLEQMIESVDGLGDEAAVDAYLALVRDGLRSNVNETLPMAPNHFDPDRHKWRKVTGEPDGSYKIHHDYTILGYDIGAGTLDMVVRWAGDGGHCPIHRHTATTTVLVLEGEQHLWDLNPDGSRGEHKKRCAGDYALSVGDALPHLERGGDQGGVAFFGNHSNDGRLYEILDDDLNVIVDVTMEALVADWKENT